MKTNELIVILGASTNPNRTSYMADVLLNKKGFETLQVSDIQAINSLHYKKCLSEKQKTITVFLKPKQQKKYYDYVISLKPKRIIFNPGTENEELIALALQHNIKVMTGCTIAMLMNSLL